MHSEGRQNDVLLPMDAYFDQPLIEAFRDGADIIYAGTLIVGANVYTIKIREYIEDDIKKFEFSDDDSLEERFSGIYQEIRNIKSRNISTYMKELVKIIDKYNPPLKNIVPMLRKIVSEFIEFEKFYINLKSLQGTPDMSSIKIVFTDQANRTHSIEIGIDLETTSDIFFFKKYDVPPNKKNILEARSSNLKELYNKFLGYIEDLQPFFDLLDLIDANCIVLDPKDCLRKYNYRRVLIEKNFSVILTFLDPCNVNSCPNLAFVGPDRLVNEFQHKIKENLENWDNQGYLYEQLLLLLGIEKFPKEPKDTSISEDPNSDQLKTNTDCSICFSSDIKGNLPDVICDNKCCENNYHRDCLFEWLSSIDSRKYFDKIQGSCPNCEKTISCPIVA